MQRSTNKFGQIMQRECLIDIVQLWCCKLVRIEQSLGIESGSKNTYTETVSSLSADVWTNLAIVLSYTIKRNSDVPAGSVKKDTFTAVSLKYSF